MFQLTELSVADGLSSLEKRCVLLNSEGKNRCGCQTSSFMHLKDARRRVMVTFFAHFTTTAAFESKREARSVPSGEPVSLPVLRRFFKGFVEDVQLSVRCFFSPGCPSTTRSRLYNILPTRAADLWHQQLGVLLGQTQCLSPQHWSSLVGTAGMSVLSSAIFDSSSATCPVKFPRACTRPGAFCCYLCAARTHCRAHSGQGNVARPIALGCLLYICSGPHPASGFLRSSQGNVFGTSVPL